MTTLPLWAPPSGSHASEPQALPALPEIPHEDAPLVPLQGRRNTRELYEPRRGLPVPVPVVAVLATAAVGLICCAGFRPELALLGRRRGLSVKAEEATCDGDGCSCDCSWADEGSCSADLNIGRHCFDACCGVARKSCASPAFPDGCVCDCSWTKTRKCDADDGGCCWGCCCGSDNSSATLVPPRCLDKKGSPTADDETLDDETLATLFCFAVMRPDGYERELIVQQYRARTSLFLCDGQAIYSNEVVELTDTLQTRLVDTTLEAQVGGLYATALNTDIFMAVWAKVLSDGDYAGYEWTVKVDPDAVFIPWRLRVVLRDQEEGPTGVYIINCKYGFHGPVEVFSRRAVRELDGGMERCERHFADQCGGPCPWGEDLYIDQCLNFLGVKNTTDFRLLMEDHCDPPPGWRSCGDPARVTFHPFKSWEEWEGCLGSATRRCPPLVQRTVTATTTTVTTTTRTTTVTTTANMSVPCDAAYCPLRGVRLTCKSRHRLEVTRRFIEESGACTLAYGAVLEMCPNCATCSLSEVGCDPEGVLGSSIEAGQAVREDGGEPKVARQTWPFLHLPSFPR